MMQLFIIYDLILDSFLVFMPLLSAFKFFSYHLCARIFAERAASYYCSFLNFMKAQQIPNIKGNQPNKGVFLITELPL